MVDLSVYIELLLLLSTAELGTESEQSCGVGLQLSWGLPHSGAMGFYPRQSWGLGPQQSWGLGPQLSWGMSHS
jgi:hypothetical protein